MAYKLVVTDEGEERIDEQLQYILLFPFDSATIFVVLFPVSIAIFLFIIFDLLISYCLYNLLVLCRNHHQMQDALNASVGYGINMHEELKKVKRDTGAKLNVAERKLAAFVSYIFFFIS